MSTLNNERDTVYWGSFRSTACRRHAAAGCSANYWSTPAMPATVFDESHSRRFLPLVGK